MMGGGFLGERPKRYRNFATVVYKDSAPADWQDLLASHCVPAFVSPYHLDDINPDGTPKKPHWHVLLMFDSVKTVEQAKEVFDTISGVGCEIVKSLRGYARYLCHLDNPDKAQYRPDDVLNFCGADYHDTIGLAIDRYVCLTEMEDFCDNYNVLSYYALSKYARRHRPDWHRVLAESGTIHMREFLKSKKWSDEVGLNTIIDPDTGESLI